MLTLRCNISRLWTGTCQLWRLFRYARVTVGKTMHDHGLHAPGSADRGESVETGAGSWSDSLVSSSLHLSTVRCNQWPELVKSRSVALCCTMSGNPRQQKAAPPVLTHWASFAHAACYFFHHSVVGRTRGCGCICLVPSRSSKDCRAQPWNT